MTIMADPDEKLEKQRWLRFTPASRRAYQSLPDEVQKHFGFALYLAELGKNHPDAKVLRGFGGASVVEVIVRHDGETYRAVYTLRLPGFQGHSLIDLGGGREVGYSGGVLSADPGVVP